MASAAIDLGTQGCIACGCTSVTTQVVPRRSARPFTVYAVPESGGVTITQSTIWAAPSDSMVATGEDTTARPTSTRTLLTASGSASTGRSACHVCFLVVAHMACHAFAAD